MWDKKLRRARSQLRSDKPLSSCFGAHTVNKLLLRPLWSHFCAFYSALKDSAEVLTGIPKRKKAVMHLMEKICVGRASFRQLGSHWP